MPLVQAPGSKGLVLGPRFHCNAVVIKIYGRVTGTTAWDLESNNWGFYEPVHARSHVLVSAVSRDRPEREARQPWIRREYRKWNWLVEERRGKGGPTAHPGLSLAKSAPKATSEVLPSRQSSLHSLDAAVRTRKQPSRSTVAGVRGKPRRRCLTLTAARHARASHR